MADARARDYAALSNRFLDGDGLQESRTLLSRIPENRTTTTAADYIPDGTRSSANMIHLPASVRVYLCLTARDMRKRQLSAVEMLSDMPCDVTDA